MGAFVLVLLAAGLPLLPASPAPQHASLTVTAIGTGATDTFTDITARGKDEREFKDKWIRFMTSASAGGFLTRVKSFDPETGRFTLYDEIPAGLVKQTDVYRLGDTPDSIPIGGVYSATSSGTCAPDGTTAA